MAIKANAKFKGIEVNNMYIKVEKIFNEGDSIEIQVGLYSLENGEKGELVELITHKVADTSMILELAYDALKDSVYPLSVDL